METLVIVVAESVGYMSVQKLTEMKEYLHE